MHILAIETSCDETAAAVVYNGWTIKSSVVASQIPIHQKYHGVVPELASRAHVENINSVVDEALRKARVKPDAIAVTIGPGLVGSLLVGRMTAETLGWVWKKPVVGVNHIEGHLLSPLIGAKNIQPPFLGLVVSGGHTDLILAEAWDKYSIIGRTRDDAAGEAFDKAAKMFQLPYPGGPSIQNAALKGRPGKQSFPFPWLERTWDFSFSGLKTAVRYRLREKKKWSKQDICDLAYGFQESVTTVLAEKTLAAARQLGLNKIVVGGGVAANEALRTKLFNRSEKSTQILIPPISLCTDNAAMIGAAAFQKLKQKRFKNGPLTVNGKMHFPIKPLDPGFTRIIS